jgi:hypothetical protein
MKRLIIVADHSLVAHSIRLALKQTSGFRIVGVIDGRMTARDALMTGPARAPTARTTRLPGFARPAITHLAPSGCC